ncbi:hypothetical protein JOM56_006036 [Amanita muscaria]
MILNKDFLPDNAGPSSSEPPPPFTDIDESSHLLIDITPLELEPPPQFAPYDAEFFTTGNGDIASHDAHLNTDGEALYRFLLSQSLQAPYYQLHCRGTHTESRPRFVNRTNSDGSTRQDTEFDTVPITDFDFYIDIYPSPPTSSTSLNDSCGPVHWSVSDSEPAYRGRMVQEIELPLGGGKRKATWSESREYAKRCSERVTQGSPPWVSRDNTSQSVALRSSKSLRQWADEYCASSKHLKEFVYEKVLYGWDIKQLEEAVRTIISTTSYDESIEVSFNIKNSKVYVRPHNDLSRMLSNKWLKFLCIIFLIYPFIWLFRRFYSGGRWEVCGGAYSFKREVTEEGPETIGRERKLIGVREGEWFRKWEGVIRRSVLRRYVSSTPITLSSDEEDHRSLVGYLDGY